jgi:hypothetical protein
MSMDNPGKKSNSGEPHYTDWERRVGDNLLLDSQVLCKAIGSDCTVEESQCDLRIEPAITVATNQAASRRWTLLSAAGAVVAIGRLFGKSSQSARRAAE